jgi:hypothetical protein
VREKICFCSSKTKSGREMKRWILTLAFILSIAFVNLLFSEQPVPSDDGVGGSNKERLGYWATVGHRKESVTCVEYALSTTGIEIRIKQGWIIWVTERCFASGKDCVPGAQREVFGGTMGC